MDWIVFGDDWGGHPSTTQHLVLNLPPEDRVIWVDSIGMRSPRLRLADLRRLASKGAALFQTGGHQESLYPGTLGAFTRIRPKVLPWHQNPLVVRANTRSLRKTLVARCYGSDFVQPTLLVSYPVVVKYLDAIPHGALVYLRLDEYSLYPGVSPELVEETEDELCKRANLIVVTARLLLPEARQETKGRYLPQGVQINHFASVPLDPPRNKVLGFFGTVAEWLDFELIEQVARRAPGWQLDFVGKIEYLPDRVAKLPNVSFRPAVPFADLPREIAGWSAAWIPFVQNELTEGVNPLKVREYLAAGFPTHCSPLPEVEDLREHILITDSAEAVAQWLEETVMADTREVRLARRGCVEDDSWAARAGNLRAWVRGLGSADL